MIFGVSGVGKRDQNRSKIDQKLTSKTASFWNPFFLRFLADFDPILAPKIPPKSLQIRSKDRLKIEAVPRASRERLGTEKTPLR